MVLHGRRKVTKIDAYDDANKLMSRDDWQKLRNKRVAFFLDPTFKFVPVVGAVRGMKDLDRLTTWGSSSFVYVPILGPCAPMLRREM